MFFYIICFFVLVFDIANKNGCHFHLCFVCFVLYKILLTTEIGMSSNA